MQKLILSIIALIICVVSIVAQPSHLTDTTLTTAKKTRVVKIYLYENPNENRPEIPGRLVAVYSAVFQFFIFDKIEVCIDDMRNLEDVLEKDASPLPCK